MEAEPSNAESPNADPPNVPATGKRRFQFSMRQLFGAVVLLGVAALLAALCLTAWLNRLFNPVVLFTGFFLGFSTAVGAALGCIAGKPDKWAYRGALVGIIGSILFAEGWIILRLRGAVVGHGLTISIDEFLALQVLFPILATALGGLLGYLTGRTLFGSIVGFLIGVSIVIYLECGFS